MSRSALAAFVSFAALTLGSTAVAADEASHANVDPDHAFAMRYRLDHDARAACGVDLNQSRMSMRMWQRQHQCLHDFFAGTLR
jgi:hypothetical protein